MCSFLFGFVLGYHREREGREPLIYNTTISTGVTHYNIGYLRINRNDGEKCGGLYNYYFIFFILLLLTVGSSVSADHRHCLFILAK